VRGVLIGNLTANAGALVVGIALLGPGRRLAFDRRLVTPLLAFGFAVLPSMLSGWVMDVSDRYLLRLFRDLDEVAQYAVGYKFGLAVQLLVTWPFQLAWPAVAFGISRDEGHEGTYARVLTYLVLVLTFILLGVTAVSRSVLPVIVGRDYVAGCAVVPIIAAAYALNALQYCVSPGIHIGGRTRTLSVIAVVAAVANLGFGLLLIPALGMVGAAWATVGAYALALVGAVWLAQRSHPVRYEYGRLARIVGAGLVTWGVMQLAAAESPGSWLIVEQAGVLVAFPLLILLSGFVTKEERAQLAGFLHRSAQA
jgi:O-antigen/teichoic acid export membrane protein